MNILLFTHYYLPGYKAGGALRTVANMVEALGDDYNFFIVTLDCDFGDKQPYSGIETELWLSVGKAKVKYYHEDSFNLSTIYSLLNEMPWNLIYLQSFWDVKFSILPIFAKRYLDNKTPVLLAPRGEFGSCALNIKSFKKKVFLTLAKAIRFYEDVYFHSSSDDEKNEITKIFPHSKKIFVALDFPEKHKQEYNNKTFSTSTLKICYLSRIVPKKNLLYALHVIEKVKVPINFDIIGPLEDSEYWKKCKNIIKNMPSFIHVNYLGICPHEKILSILAQYELFFFPTLNENFGHVIYEALQVGLPILTSDQTPWHELENRNAGWEIPLTEKDSFVDKIEYYSKLSKNEKKKMSNAALQYGISIKQDNTILENNKRMFNFFLNNN